jgi:hypothetical protein
MPTRSPAGAANLITAALLFLASCAGLEPPVAPPDSNTAVKLPATNGGLTISTPDLTNDGRFAKIRGRVTNSHTEGVDGIRYLVRIQTRDTVPRTLDQFKFETTDRLAPGESAMMRLDVESMYLSTASEIEIVAVPKKLGEQAVPLPAGWN